MKRREFIVGLVEATALPFAARAQQSARIPHVVQLSPVDVPSQANSIRTRMMAEPKFSS
jgi:hypothetical protein